MHNIQNWDKNAMPKAKDMELLRVKNEKKKFNFIDISIQSKL